MSALGLQQAVGPGKPNRPADVRLVEQWLNWWIVALNHMPFARLEDGITWFQSEVMGDPFPTGVVEPRDTTASNLQQRPGIAPAEFPVRPPVGPLPKTPETGTALRLPARSGFDPLSEDDYGKAAKDLGAEALAVKAVAKQESGAGGGFDQYNRPAILYEPLHFLKASRPWVTRPNIPYFRGHFRTDYPALTKLKPPPHPYGDLNANWKFLQWAYLLEPREAIRDVSWGQFQILGSNFREAGFGTAEDFVISMCMSLQEHLNAFVHFLQSIGAADALAKKDWAAFAQAYNGPAYKDKHYDLQIEAKYNALVAASKR